MPDVAIVTGGGRGIGAATARALATRGWSVCVGYLEDAASATRVAESCGKAIAVAADVSSPADVRRLFEAADSLGRLGALVNNAGIVAPPVRVDGITAERIERIFAVNVVGAFLCAREAVLRMSTLHGGTGGVIVNVSSAAARLGSPGEYVDYAASKGAIDTFTLGLAKEVAEESIRVNAARPGLVRTDIHERGGQPGRVERLQSQIPVGRAGEPQEVAHAIAWLCSDEASYTTGAILDVAGGR